MVVIQWKMRENPIHNDPVNGLGTLDMWAYGKHIIWTLNANKNTYEAQGV